MTGRKAAIRLALMLALCAGLPAVAQETPVRDTLLAGVSCSGEGQADQIMLNTARLVSAPEAVNAALAQIGSDPAVCKAIKRAATEVLVALTGDVTGAMTRERPDVLAAARLRLEEALREADARAANASFEVGPPPRNLTRGEGRTD